MLAINEIAVATGRLKIARITVQRTAKPMKGYPSFATGTCGVSMKLYNLCLRGLLFSLICPTHGDDTGSDNLFDAYRAKDINDCLYF